MTAQQRQIEQLQHELQMQKASGANVENASLNASGITNTPVDQSDVEKPKTSPLSIRIGGTEFTPGGFVDFNNIFRTTNTGSVVSTNWSTIPFSNSANGHLTEYRSTGQYSRFNLKVSGKYGENNFNGFIEGDFNGNDANNVFVTTNPHTFRLRLYYLQLKRNNVGVYRRAGMVTAHSQQGGHFRIAIRPRYHHEHGWKHPRRCNVFPRCAVSCWIEAKRSPLLGAVNRESAAIHDRAGSGAICLHVRPR